MGLKQLFNLKQWQEDDLPEWFKFSILIVTFGAVFWALITSWMVGSTRVGDPPASVYEASAAILLSIGLLVFTISWLAKVGGLEKRAIYASQAAAIWCISLAFVVFPAVDRHTEAAQFNAANVQQWTSIQRLVSAEESAGIRSGDRYFVRTAQQSEPFEISSSDYKTIGGADPSGFCLRLQVQRSGSAMRILDRAPFNPGTVIHCPPGAE